MNNRVRAVLSSRLFTSAADAATTAAVAVTGPLLKLLARWRIHLPWALNMADRYGISIRSTHYLEPTFDPRGLRRKLCEERELPGIDLNEATQLRVIAAMNYADELRLIPLEGDRDDRFAYNRGPFGSGDAELLYDFIRLLKPRRILEVGSGSSTLMAQLALKANVRDDPDYRCDHICIEPFEAPWLESVGVTVLREKVEDVDRAYVEKLEANDILFVDSSHVIRPQGDVLHEVFSMYPALKPGVYVHVHDIFTPRDYPEQWVCVERKLWNEQYLLEAFLSHNREFEVVAALNWLHHHHPDKLGEACPILSSQPEREPGSFWFRRVSAPQAVANAGIST